MNTPVRRSPHVKGSARRSFTAVRLAPEIDEKVRGMAREQNRSLGNMIEQLIRLGLQVEETGSAQSA